uniref:Uncharacterized protein n=1 Tax=Amphora coffeiformis TaxID=265554 RepID=A0A7S3LGC5_9STRA
MTSEVASMLEHALVELKPSLARDGTPWLQPISDSTLSTTSSRSQLSDIDDYPCSMEDEYSNPATNTSTEMDLKDEESTSGPARKPSKVRWGSVDGKSSLSQCFRTSRLPVPLL